jgi:hypothetical protein
MKTIPLTQNRVAIVDDADFEKVMAISPRWYAQRIRDTVYACYDDKTGEKRKLYYMHRVVANAPSSLHVDHKDGNGLNNQRANLRVCTSGENSRNKRAIKNQYKGAFRQPNGLTWFARVTVNGKHFHSCGHKTAESAAHAYDALAREHHGEFARLNFPNEQPVLIG